MAISAHLEELNNKHTQLDGRIQAELQHPAPDNVRITALKKKKLQLKEKIIHYRSN